MRRSAFGSVLADITAAVEDPRNLQVLWPLSKKDEIRTDWKHPGACVDLVSRSAHGRIRSQQRKGLSETVDQAIGGL
jgi:hypothetical protein